MEAQSFAVHIRLTASGSRFPATVMFAEWRYLRSGLSSQDSASFPRGWVTAREAQPGGLFQQRRRSHHQSGIGHRRKLGASVVRQPPPGLVLERAHGRVGCASHEARVVPSAASGSVPATTRRRRATPGWRPRPRSRPSGTLVVSRCPPGHAASSTAARGLSTTRSPPVRASALRKARVARLSASGWVSTAVRNAASLASSATKRIPGAAKRSVTVSGNRARPAPAATASSTCSTRGSASLRTSARVRRYGTLRPSRCGIRGWPLGEARPAGPAPAARGRSPR
jgi:hypothetical protein